jgi:hypothetical protein
MIAARLVPSARSVRPLLVLAGLVLGGALLAAQTLDRAAVDTRLGRIFRDGAYEPPAFGPARWMADGAAYSTVEPSGPLRGELAVPPDKSISHRLAILGAMSDEPVRITNLARLEGHGVDHREEGGREADAEDQRANGDERKGRPPPLRSCVSGGPGVRPWAGPGSV